MRSSRTLPLHPCLFALQPAVFLYARNIADFPLGIVYGPALALLAGAGVLWVVLAALVRNWQKAALIASLVVVWFFSFGPVRQAVQSAATWAWGPTFGPGKVVLPLTVAALALGIWFVCRTRRTPELTRMANLISVVVLALPLATAGLSHGRHRPGAEAKLARTLPQPAASLPSDRLPNIFFIVLDSYARQDTLRRIYHVDNASFLQHLRQRGFYVADRSCSNYAETDLSLPATLNLDYLPQVMGPLDPASHDHITPRAFITGSRVFEFARARGYRLIAFESGCWATTLDHADRLLGPSTLRRDFSFYLLDQTPLARALGHLRTTQDAARREQVMFALNHVAEAAQSQPGPVFVFAHLMAPHPPFVFGPRGEPVCGRPIAVDWRGPEASTAGGQARWLQCYAEEVQYVTTMAQRMVDGILANARRPTAILLQADHGPNGMTRPGDLRRTDVLERMAILNAIYLPDRDYSRFYPGITSVNTMRAALNRCWGLQLPLLPDESHYSFLESPYDTVRVDPLWARQAPGK